MLYNKIFYLSNASFGGWVTFTYHLCKLLGINEVLTIKDTYKGGGRFYEDVKYVNIKQNIIPKFENSIIVAIDKQHLKYLNLFKKSFVIIHDPTELHDEVIQFCRQNTVITIRKAVSELLTSMGIQNVFYKHPYYKYNKIIGSNKYNRSLSRIDFDKNTDIICRANNLGAKIEIWGSKNFRFVYNNSYIKGGLKSLGFDDYYKGQYAKDLSKISKLYADTNYLVDLSTIKKDGGGTQYTFLEAEYHKCGMILHKDWCNVKDSLYVNGINCYAVKDEYELLEALKMPKLYSNNLPTENENNNWKKLIL
jgi:hypothetical protein